MMVNSEIKLGLPFRGLYGATSPFEAKLYVHTFSVEEKPYSPTLGSE